MSLPSEAKGQIPPPESAKLFPGLTSEAKGLTKPTGNAKHFQWLICIGASWGGLDAVGRLLTDIPEDVEQPIVIAQHRHPDTMAGVLPELLGLRAARRIEDVEDKLPIELNRVYLAPPDYHLLVERGSFALSIDERVQFARPSIDVLFESAADAYGPAVIGIILTGANDDGAAGLARIKEVGGIAVVQDPDDATRRAMPEAALTATVADAVLPLEEIGKFVYGVCLQVPEAPVREADRWKGGGEAARPRSGPVEGVWGNREVPPAGAEAARPRSGPVEGVWGNREVPPDGAEDRRKVTP